MKNQQKLKNAVRKLKIGDSLQKMFQKREIQIRLVELLKKLTEQIFEPLIKDFEITVQNLQDESE